MRSSGVAGRMRGTSTELQASDSPGPWNFHEALNKGKGVIALWIDTSRWSVKTRANFDRSIDHLKALPRTMWHKPHPASKVGNHIYVIRFKDVSAQQLRVFGHFFESHRAFVMTLHGYEKDNVYYPEKYQSMAEQHYSACSQDFSSLTVAFEDHCQRC